MQKEFPLPASRSIMAVSILVYSVCNSLIDSDEERVSGVQSGVVNTFCISSNCRYKPSVSGYSDISVEIEDKEIGILIEFKYAENAAFDEGCQKALKQIKDKNYEETLIDDGMKTIYRYGIACYKKRCKVISG